MILLATYLLAQEPAAPTPAVPPTAPPSAVSPPAATVAPAIDPASIVGPPAGPPQRGAALESQTHTVAKLLRCPVCQGLSVADSPSESALAMQAEVQDLVAAGYDEEQILLYFEASYGQFIRLEPTFDGINVLVWCGPGALVLLGGAWILRSVRRGGRARPASALAAPEVDPALRPYLERVRAETR